ncbi:MAG TPA: OB-fold nucleic acid binding domain-containing protein, partial [Gaiellales bacterium]|nr:OB-fold nucleic acid binding domain-containing protein [Gaiellales bacterium]
AAFAILAYQSAWLHRSYPAEFLCSLLNAQPMGFYPPATLLRDGERRGVEMRPPDVNRSGATCTVEDGGAAVRIGLGYVKGVGTRAEGLVAERDAEGAFTGLGELVRRAPLSSDQLASLIRAGACDAFDANRRRLLWELPLHRAPAGAGVEGAAQLALALDASPTPALPRMTDWERMVSDHEAMSLTTGPHPLALLRPSLAADITTSDRLLEAPLGQVTIAGITIARQRPGTAKGIVFLLVEDEHGMTNVICPPAVYERDRIAIRAEPLVQVWGRLERRDGAVNVIADRVTGLTHAARPDVGRAAERAAARAAGTGAGQGGHVADLRRLRAAAPRANSFGRGRR